MDKVEHHFPRITGIRTGGAFAEGGVDADDQFDCGFAGEKGTGIVEITESDDIGSAEVSDELLIGVGHGTVADEADIEFPIKIHRESGQFRGADGERHRPVMIHRVVLGSIERFIGVITEHFGGAFPTWLSPVQVKVMPITDRSADYAKKVAAELDAAGVRVETDLRNEKINLKIREAQVQKIPYMLVLGDKEAESGMVAVRSRKGTQEVMSTDALLAKMLEEIRTKAL